MRTQEQDSFINEFDKTIKELQKHDVSFEKLGETHHLRWFCENMITIVKDIILTKGNDCLLTHKYQSIISCEDCLDSCYRVLDLLNNNNFNVNSKFPSGFLLYSRIRIKN